MEIEHLRTVLRVMNLTAPLGMIWCAWFVKPSNTDLEVEYAIHATYRFYLVTDDSGLPSQEDVITA